MRFYAAITASWCSSVPPYPNLQALQAIARSRSTCAYRRTACLRPCPPARRRRHSGSEGCPRSASRPQSEPASARGSDGRSPHLYLEDRERQGHAHAVVAGPAGARAGGRHLRPCSATHPRATPTRPPCSSRTPFLAEIAAYTSQLDQLQRTIFLNHVRELARPVAGAPPSNRYGTSSLRPHPPGCGPLLVFHQAGRIHGPRKPRRNVRQHSSPAPSMLTSTSVRHPLAP